MGLLAIVSVFPRNETDMKLRYIMLTIMLPMLALVGYFCVIEYRALAGSRDRADATARAADEVTAI